ncbi:N-ethylmaleimide reductase [mine drainage metagenome]|uniref:N-ethylmaleimide reductase n=1 Tax=mine drainage metagenome TaxID=410659 RepID=A0A1J5QD06_9ZZZZ
MVMAPLTRCRAGEGNVPTDLIAEYYRQRASAGLIISEATQIMPEGQGYPSTPGIYSLEQIAGWKKVTSAVHAAGGKIVLQLWHVGRVSHSSFQPGGVLPVAPSAIRPAGQVFTYTGLQDFVTPRALAAEEIPALLEDDRHASELALQAGFDGVEVHAANGYLIDQFLRDGTNHRTDQYGGSIANRCRLLVEVVATVAKVWGADRVGVRISPINQFNDIRDSNPQALFNHVAEVLNLFKLAYLHVVEVGMTGDAPQAFDFAELRRAFQGNYMANGGYDKARGNAAIASGHADCVAYGTPFIANPDLVERFAKDAPLNVADQNTFYGGSEQGYTDYPALAAH